MDWSRSTKRSFGGYWVGALSGLGFLVFGALFLNYAGLQTDEMFFAGPLFRDWWFFAISVGHYQVPIMHMSYVGALKTWVYAPILVFARPTPAVLRIVAVSIGSATIFAFALLLDRIHGRRAAIAGCVLLATDTMFLLNTVFDLGPAVLQHLMLVLAMLFAVRWFQDGKTMSLALSAFCCGLAFWDKAVFIWVFCGVLLGLLPQIAEVRQRLKWRPAGIAVACFFVGILPLLVYNFAADDRFATIRSNSHFSLQGLSGKVDVLRDTWNGSAWFGYLVNEDSASQPKSPNTVIERWSFRLRALVGEHRSNALTLAFVIGLGLVHTAWRRARTIITFCLIAMIVAWLQMVAAGGGGSAHHVVLLWPLPHVFLATVFAEASVYFQRVGRIGFFALLAFFAITNILVTNQYLYQMARDGPAGSWTDAVYPLADDLRASSATRIVLPDWGLLDSLAVLNEGEPPVQPIVDPSVWSTLPPAERDANIKVLSDERAIWVEHTLGNEQFEGINERVRGALSHAGFEQVFLHEYSDRNGRSMFQTFRLIRRH